MNKIYIYHHLGLGDHFICNGLVREITNNKNNNYCLFVKNRNSTTVKSMFSDIDNLEIECVDNNDGDFFIRNFLINRNNVKSIEKMY